MFHAPPSASIGSSSLPFVNELSPLFTCRRSICLRQNKSELVQTIMDTTPRLELPYIAAQQAQKHVTFNTALQALDLLVQPSVKSRTLTTPPGGPAEGDSYIVGTGATGGWAGKDADFATWIDGHWVFRSPANGWLSYVEATAEIAIHQSGSWAVMVSNGGSTVATFGINAAADLTNRLVSAADATLLTHDGTSHRAKINKAATADTASLLFQSNFTTHAEFGLTGDNNWHVKVSPNGSSWVEALVANQTTGALTAAAALTAPAFVLDAEAQFTLAAGVVSVALDSGDVLKYTRGGNVLALTIGAADRFTWSTAGFRPAADNAVGLGGSGLRWTSIWAANGTIQTSDETQKTDIEVSDLGLDFIRALRPVSYRWRIGGNEEVDGEYIARPGRRRHYGLIAQQVKAALDAAGVADFGGYVKTDTADPASEEGLRYDQFVAPLVAAVQRLATEAEALARRIEALEGKP